MENPQEIDNSTMWYFHPNETIRMLRYYQFNIKFDNGDYTVKYPETPEIGVVIGTYGSVAYIDLQLHYLINVNKIKHVLIHDDCSDKQAELKELAKKYNVDFYSTDKRMYYRSCVGSIGDTNAFFIGLEWAKSKNLDILVKLSRRLIPCYNWKHDLITLEKNSDANTFSSFCTKDPFNLRTECVGLHVKSWSNNYPMQCMNFTIQNEYTIFAEFWFHELAKTLAGNNNSKLWEEYQKKYKFGYLHSGYAMWQDILGTCRYNSDNRHSNVLWHMYSKSEDYLEKSKEIFGNKYTIEDFKE